MLWYGLGRPVITSEIGNWSVFVLLGWRFVFRIIMKWDGREPHIVRCHHDSGNNKAGSLLRILKPKWVLARTTKIGRPPRGYSVPPPSHLTKWRRRQTMGRWSWVRISRPPWKRFLKNSEFPHVKNLINHSPWVPRDCKELRSRHVRPHAKTKNPAVQRGGECCKA